MVCTLRLAVSYFTPKSQQGIVTFQLISLHKVLSQVLHVQSQTGDVNISNLYANNSKILTEKGNVHIVNSHMDTDVMVRRHGNVKIGENIFC